ncbi:MAG: PrsW family glutamic-type intramembrane protease [Spirochaetes bacterium]|nr:PrsW family glutamic-type intramembrane protease [Spirochaetota bacterium]
MKKAAYERKGVWVSTLLGIAGSIVLVLLVSLLEPVLAPLLRAGGGGRLVESLVLALLPAFIWLVVFYRLDSVEPEPKGFVIGMFILGAILAQGVAVPVLDKLFDVNSWIGRTGLAGRILVSILTFGVVQEYLKYAAVRFTVYGSQEFDERSDGVVYGSAAGLGFAAMLNMGYLLGLDGMDLSVAVTRVVITTLAHACAGGISGYFLGRAKLEDMPFWWLPLGVLVAAVVNGTERIFLQEVSQQGISFKPIYGLALAAVVAAAAFWILFYLIRRVNSQTIKSAREEVKA